MGSVQSVPTPPPPRPTTPALPPSSSERGYAAAMPYASAYVPTQDFSAYRPNEKLYVQNLALQAPVKTTVERFTEDSLVADAQDAAFVYNVWGLATAAKNANEYLRDTTDKELSRIDQIDRTTQKQIYKSKHLAMQAEYLVNYYKFVTNVVILTLVVTLLALSIAFFGAAGMVRLVLLGITIVAYFVTLVFLFRTYAYRRRNNNWSQVYWDPGAIVRNELNTQPGCST